MHQIAKLLNAFLVFAPDWPPLLPVRAVLLHVIALLLLELDVLLHVKLMDLPLELLRLPLPVVVPPTVAELV